MSNMHKAAFIALAVGLFAAPALADGRDRSQPVGPTPLQPAVTQHCENGHYADGRCYIPARQTQQRVIRRHAPQATVRRVVHQPATQTVRRASAPNYDFSAFNGGVGANVSGGFGGGRGGVIVLNSGPRFSGVLSNPAARISFGHRKGGGCGGC